MPKKRHRLIGLGGTFDHFHDGHAHFISYAATMGEKILIGITQNKLTKHKPYAHTLEPYRVRKNHVWRYCHKQQIPCEIVELSDPYGPTILRGSTVEALCVTPETIRGSEKINEIRQASGMRPLPVYICPLLKDEMGHDLHADRIRAGEVNREGKVYAKHLHQDIPLSEDQKKLLRKPLGELVLEPTWETAGERWLVGDATLEKFLVNEWAFTRAIYDGQEQRHALTTGHVRELTPSLTTVNQAGSVSAELVKAIQQLKTENLPYLKVNGEEDLATAALILLLPLEDVIYYGQPNEGLVEVVVTEQLKEKIFKILFV